MEIGAAESLTNADAIAFAILSTQLAHLCELDKNIIMPKDLNMPKEISVVCVFNCIIF